MSVNAVRSLDSALRAFGRQLVESRPELRRVFLRTRDWYVRAFVATSVWANRVRYDAPIDPYRLIDVDPNDIEHLVEFKRPKFHAAGRVVGGDWDRTDRRFEDLDVYRAYERHFEEGVPWSETDFFDRVVAEIGPDNEQWGCSNRSEFEARCRRLDDLYETLETEGYRTQAELRNSTEEDPIKDPHALKTERYKNEIAVHIGRDGELLFSDGRNRLSMAKLLDLDSVPVRVLHRHETWQAVRDAYVRGVPAVETYGDHPDVTYLEFGSKD